MRTLRCSALALALTAIPTAAFSQPLWSASDCDDTSGVYDNMESTSANVIDYYIQGDFAEQLKDCTGLSDDEMTESHIRTHIKDTFEIWNAESRGAALRYGGYYSGDPDDVCDAVSAPAIFVRFEPGCDFNGSCSAFDTSGSARDLPDCDNTAVITIYGDTNTNGDCTGTEVFDWHLDESTQTYSFYYRTLRGTLIHEIGHILGLGHPNQNSVPDVSSTESVMWSQSIFSVDYAGNYKHLHPWEKDCVDEHWGGRQGLARSRSYNSTGSLIEDETITATYTEKGSLSGAPWRIGGIITLDYYAYSIVDPTGDYRLAFVDSNGSLSWIDSGSDWTVSGAPDASILFTNIYPGSSYSHIYYHRATNRDTDPPELKAIYTTGDFSSKSWGVVYAWNGTGWDQLYTHVPITSAYDPISGETVFVTIDTERTSSTEGGIRVHPGHRSGYRYLENFEYVHANATTPLDSYTRWNYKRKTYFAAGVGCADELVGGGNGHNCVVAWIDRGTPDNAVLYTWFKISGTDVVWEGTSHVRANAYGINHVAIGFFDDKLHMAFKNLSSSVGIAMTSNALSSYTGWTTVSHYYSDGYLIDPPTWYARDSSSEAALMWSETP